MKHYAYGVYFGKGGIYSLDPLDDSRGNLYGAYHSILELSVNFKIVPKGSTSGCMVNPLSSWDCRCRLYLAGTVDVTSI